jgi:hypothetical protein
MYRLRHFVNMANMAKCSKLGEIIPKTMEQRFKSLSLFEFQERFSNAADCLKYLADEKWGNGFVCRKCGHTHSCAGKATQSRQCTCCRYVESPTAQTLFHKVKFEKCISTIKGCGEKERMKMINASQPMIFLFISKGCSSREGGW